MCILKLFILRCYWLWYACRMNNIIPYRKVWQRTKSNGINHFSISCHFSGLLSLSLFFFFKGHTCGIWKFPGQWSRGWIRRSCSFQPTPQPQQCQVWATSATYTTSCSNAGPLTDWVRPGIELTFSWILVGLLTCWATMGTPRLL